MAIEIERKFLVLKELLPLEPDQGTHMVQGYLATGPVNVRVRLTDSKAFLTLKSTGAGLRRQEFEYLIPMEDAKELLARPELLGKLSKRRHLVPVEGFVFEVDVYEGALTGLVTAEVELPSEETRIPLPEWLGAELSHRKDYSNESLARFGLPADFVS